MKNNFSLPIKYEQQQFNDDRFLKLKIYVMHDGLNLNNSNFEMDSIENAKDTIKNIPILAFVKEIDGEDQKDFAGHEMELIFKDDEFKIKYLGRPIGIIPADNNNYHYENIDDKTYVVVDGYVWKDYANDALDILERDGVKSQSMEIVLDSFSYTDDGVCNIAGYKYTGVTLLGDDVLPAMVNAKAEVITSQTFNKNEFKNVISEMMNELKFAIEGGKEMGKECEEKQCEAENEIPTEDEMDKMMGDTPEDKSTDENKDQPLDKDMMSKNNKEFSLTSEQLEDELSRLLCQETFKDDWGWECSCYWYVDHMPDQSIVIAYDCEDGYLVGFNYTVNGDVVVIDMKSEQRFKVEYVPMQAELDEDDQQFSFVPSAIYEHYKEEMKDKESIKSKFSKVEKELNELREFKSNKLAEERSEAESEIFDRFSSELSEDEIKGIKDNSSKYSLEELEDKLFALAGRKKIKFNTTHKNERIKMGVFETQNELNSEKDIWTEQKEKFSSNK